MTNQPEPLLFLLPNAYRAFYGAFPHLHPIQKQAVRPILQGLDLIVQSKTGSGKTEAVLAPCVEQVIKSKEEKAILYVVPTRALAIDLERRLTPILTGRLGLGIGIRTGDIKRPGGEKPSMLLTTPESLDVAIGSSNERVRAFLKRIAIVVIDEVHPLLHTYRGKHLACLLRRLELLSGQRPQKIAISATIADPAMVISFFHFRKDSVRLLTTAKRTILPHLVHIKNEVPEFSSLIDDLYERWGYKKILIFANSRACCDRLFELVNPKGRFEGVCELHYSNLKSKERKGVETRFRKRERSLCISTSTLELGIDVGNVDAVVLFEPPDSVSAFLQRVGRSNRRKQKINFWGVCRGETPGKHLLRFLALIDLARQGVIESPPEKNPVSCLVQQVLSCLYEKREISLHSLKKLYPDHSEEFDSIFPAMEKQGWIKRNRRNKLFHGGWRYRNFLLDKKIWSNFPESEEEYTLVISGESIADLPASLVRQLEIGDRVQLAGKRIQVTDISDGPGKYVEGKPSERLDEKELFWVGAGSHVSYEVAQGVKGILSSPEAEDEKSGNLFTRTKKLVSEEREKSRRVVKLANGIFLARTPQGLYHYQTFLGSLGNLILERSIEHFLSVKDENFSVTFDETGVVCSHKINFNSLDLPSDEDKLHLWAKKHKKPLQAIFPINLFFNFLPPHLKVEELMGFIFDPRLISAFATYLRCPDHIVEGDPSILNWQNLEEKRATVTFFDCRGESLLDLAKREIEPSLDEKESTANRNLIHTPQRMTGTFIGEFIRLNQCARFLSYHFLPQEKRPKQGEQKEDPLRKTRVERGREREARTLSSLRTKCNELFVINERGKDGRTRSLKERFEHSVQLINEGAASVLRDPQRSLILSQAVLMLPSFLLGETTIEAPSGSEDGASWQIIFQRHRADREGPPAGKTEVLLENISGVGIPDLLYISMKEGKIILEVGDIKGSSWYNQKWQVAFYALLLKRLISQKVLDESISIKGSGFILTSPHLTDNAPKYTGFDLLPYYLTFPSLQKKIRDVLVEDPQRASYRLTESCTTCPWFKTCYREALLTEDIQFLSPMTTGTLQKFRTLGIRSIQQAEEYFSKENETCLFHPDQREDLKIAVTAFHFNKIGISSRNRDAFPGDLCSSIYFHIVADPVTGAPAAMGLRVSGQHGKTPKTLIWRPDSDFTPRWNDFLETFRKLLRGAFQREPHVFYFGRRSLDILKQWDNEKKIPFVHEVNEKNLTDLHHLMSRSFFFPAPGALSLFALSHLLGFKPVIREPASLFHRDHPPLPGALIDEAEESLETILILEEKLANWAKGHLKGGIERDFFSPGSSSGPLESMYIRAIEEEERARAKEILRLQSYPLMDRVARFRSIGPLSFLHSALDDEGGFLYLFQTEEDITPSRFREGDFLRLCPLGIANLQDGMKIILTRNDRKRGEISVRSREGRLPLNQQIRYSLEEESQDWNTPKLIKIVQTVFSGQRPLRTLFFGAPTLALPSTAGKLWVEEWLQKNRERCGLNQQQQKALKLPFQGPLSLIEGPPGTGKTHLLGWIIIALFQHAKEAGTPLSIAVSALTHKAIDNVLLKLAALLREDEANDFPAECFKWGRFDGYPDKCGVKPLESVETLFNSPYTIVGSTGFGLYRLFGGDKGKFPRAFDWVIFDEASQMLVPQALLSMVHGKSNFIFIGDTKQLPPVIHGNPGGATGSAAHQSVLSHLLHRYGGKNRVQLQETYRMNRELALFPGVTWYGGKLRAAPGNEKSRLYLKKNGRGELLNTPLSPHKPVSLLLLNHENCHGQSDEEAQVAAKLAFQLITHWGLRGDQLALLSPHRAQNDRVACYLNKYDIPELPVIDTVERLQGSERDVVIFSFTSSDPDMVESEFINSPNRFNVAITRARHKLIVIGSELFFGNVARTEERLERSHHIKAFYEYCRRQNSLFRVSETGIEIINLDPFPSSPMALIFQS